MSIIKSLKSVAIASLAILIPSIALAAGGNLRAERSCRHYLLVDFDRYGRCYRVFLDGIIQS